jgi:hypothetical protein
MKFLIMQSSPASRYFLPLTSKYEGVSESFRTESTRKYTLTTINTRWEATQRVMAAQFTILTHKISIQLHLVAESCTICSSRSRRPVRKLLDTPSYSPQHSDLSYQLLWLHLQRIEEIFMSWWKMACSEVMMRCCRVSPAPRLRERSKKRRRDVHCSRRRVHRWLFAFTLSV